MPTTKDAARADAHAAYTKEFNRPAEFRVEHHRHHDALVAAADAASAAWQPLVEELLEALDDASTRVSRILSTHMDTRPHRELIERVRGLL